MEFISKSGVRFTHEDNFKGKLDICKNNFPTYGINIDIDSLWEFYNHIIETFHKQALEAQQQPREFTIYDARRYLDNTLCGYSWFRGSEVIDNYLIVYGNRDSDRALKIVPFLVDKFPVAYRMIE